MVQIDNFDATKEKPMNDFSPLPDGDYRVIIESSIERQNRAGTANYLAIAMQVLDGEYKGRKIFTNLNLWHPKAEAVSMARAELSSICRACGVLTPQDTSELHDRPMVVTLQVKKRQDTGEMQNVIKGYKVDGPVSQSTDSDDAPWAK